MTRFPALTHPLVACLSRLALAWVCLLSASLPAQAADGMTTFLHDHPRYEVLPAPYFDEAMANASYLDVELRPYSFMPRAGAWFAEIDTGVVQRVPAVGAS